MFTPAMFVKKKYFISLESKKDAFMEQDAKNQEDIQNILSLINARLTTPDP